MNNEFIKRFISSIILLPLSFYFIIQGTFFLIFLTVICFIIACFEWHMMSKKKSHTIYGFLFLLTILISTVSQLGDIIVSYFKRLSKIKNTGKLIPGHGGLLDRIDGMIFAFPVYYLINLNGYLNI